MNENGETFVDDLTAGDVWFFPPCVNNLPIIMSRKTNKSPSGIPHSIQALDDGVEFLLVFDQGDFSEDNTFLVTEVFLRNPVSFLSTPSVVSRQERLTNHHRRKS